MTIFANAKKAVVGVGHGVTKAFCFRGVSLPSEIRLAQLMFRFLQRLSRETQLVLELEDVRHCLVLDIP